jgi:hypothetical protein
MTGAAQSAPAGLINQTRTRCRSTLQVNPRQSTTALVSVWQVLTLLRNQDCRFQTAAAPPVRKPFGDSASAQLTRMSTPPKWRAVSSAHRAQSSAFRTSPCRQRLRGVAGCLCSTGVRDTCRVRASSLFPAQWPCAQLLHVSWPLHATIGRRSRALCCQKLQTCAAWRSGNSDKMLSTHTKHAMIRGPDSHGR